jgi:hypothetical protein
MEHAIFNHAKKMSRAQHLEAKELEDDAGIVSIIQNAQVLPISPEEEEGEGMFAKLKTPQQVFGRPDRHKYHRYGTADAKPQDKPRKKTKTTAKTGKSTAKDKGKALGAQVPDGKTAQSPVNPATGASTPSQGADAHGSGFLQSFSSIFGNGFGSN